MTDETLEKVTFSGERGKQFMRLYIGAQRRLYGFVLSLVPNPADAEDIVQNTVATMWSEFDKFAAGSDFVAWALSIARYQILTYRKQKKTNQRRFSEIAIEAIQKMANSSDKEEDHRRDALNNCLKKLKENDRKILFLRYETGATLKAVSERVGLNISTLYKMLGQIHTLLLRCIQRSMSGEMEA